MSDFHKKIFTAITEATEHGMLKESNGVLTGFSGECMIGALQRFVKSTLNEHTCYLEVGVYQGLTLLSVAQSVQEYDVFGIDNFAYFDKDGKNYGIAMDRMKKLNISNAHIINEDYEDALEQLEHYLQGKKVGVYFIDGPHDYRSQLMCLALIKPYLAENAVIIVDDSNYRHVRQANRDYLMMDRSLKLFYESYTPEHPLNTDAGNRAELQKTWWNGVNIIVTDPDNELKEMYPPTLRSRTLFENGHAIHSSKHPEVIPFLFKLTDLMAPIVYRFSKLKHRDHVIKGKYTSMNTYSDQLPTNHFNQSAG